MRERERRDGEMFRLDCGGDPFSFSFRRRTSCGVRERRVKLFTVFTAFFAIQFRLKKKRELKFYSGFIIDVTRFPPRRLTSLSSLLGHSEFSRGEGFVRSGFVVVWRGGIDRSLEFTSV
jgi:hypothetical protein